MRLPNRAVRRRLSRAFTLIELMVVVVLIGVLTVLAIPSMGQARYNARTLDDATQIGELYREARTRSLQRGAAQLVTASSSGTTVTAWPGAGGDLGTFMLYEAQVPPSAGGASGTSVLPGGSPLNTCAMPLTNWATITGVNAATSLIDQVNLNRLAEQNAQLWSVLSDTAVQGAMSVCFTPLGRTYYVANTSPTFVAGVNVLHGDVQISIQRSGVSGTVTGVTRTVIVPDSGATRIISR